jgi:hypothetical protein
MRETIAQPWRPDPRCCWCQKRFVEVTVTDVTVWVCPSAKCFARCAKWAQFEIITVEKTDDKPAHQAPGPLAYLPLPKQAMIYEAIETGTYRKIHWGGAVAGAKSFGLRWLAYHFCRRFEHFRVLLLRRTFSELEADHLDFAEREVGAIGGKLSRHRVTFPATGAQLVFGHCANPNDYAAYRSSQWDLILFDQLETFIEKQFREIGARTGRIRRIGWRGLVLSADNPGGPLAKFIDELFISKNPDRAKFPAYDPAEHLFIPASLSDNPYVDSGYADFLMDLDPDTREMYLHGRRDIFPRQFFPSFKAATHVAPMTEPAVKWFRSLRWGYHDAGAVLWWAVLADGRLHVRAMLPLEKLDEADAARQMRAVDASLGIRAIAYTVANAEVFHATTPRLSSGFVGASIADTLSSAGISLTRGDDDCANGWQRLRSVWRPRVSDRRPWLTVDGGCPALVAAVQHALSDETHPDDLDLQQPSALLDALRLGVMSRPAPDAVTTPVVYPVGSPGYYMQQDRREGQRSMFGKRIA